MGNKVEKINLQASLRVPRMAKNGEDGIGILSADVVFAVGKSKTDSSDIKDTAWRTTFAQLTLQKGYYVWSCTLVTLTGNAGKRYTGKYCLGECYDFAEVTELYALTDSGTQQPDDNASTWTASYQPTKGKYLWTCSRVKYSNSDSYSYLNKKCIAYFPKDGTNGTSFTPQGTAKAHYEKSSQIPGGYKAGEVYIVDSHDAASGAIAAPCVIIILELTTGKYTFGVKKASAGDAYNVDGELWVNKGEKWVDFGSCQGPKGDDGADALRVNMSPNQLVFKCNDQGQIVDASNKVYTMDMKAGVSLTLMKGSKNVTAGATVAMSTVSGGNFTDTNDHAYLSAANYKSFIMVGVCPLGIDTTIYTVGGNQKTLPKNAAYVRATITYDGQSLIVDIPIFVEFSAKIGGLESDMNGLKAEYTQLDSTVSAQGATLTQHSSLIQANANAINLRVTQDDFDAYQGQVTQQFSSINMRYESLSMSVSSTQQGLLDTGIDITDKTINLTANNFGIYNNKGELTISVDENGNLVTTGSAKIQGSIEANDGRIGSFFIENEIDKLGFRYYGLSASQSGYGVFPENSIVLSYGGIYSRTGQGGDVGIVTIGTANRNTISGLINWSSGILRIVGDTTGGNASWKNVGVSINMSYKEGQECRAIEANGGDIVASSGNVEALKGCLIGGLRPTNKVVSYDYYVQHNDCTLICTNTSTITLTLPSNPKSGQTCFIFQAGGGNVIVATSKEHPIVSKGNDYPTGTTHYTKANVKNQMTILIYGNDGKWYSAWMNG